MAENDDLRHRIDRLEKLVEAIATKVGVEETVLPGTLLQPPVPPPVRPNVVEMTPEPAPSTPELKSKISPEPEPVATVKPVWVEPKQKRDKDATEYLIGRKYLPNVGGVVVVFGIIALVILAISRGLITPQVQFGGELTLCAVFAAIGVWKVNEKDNFGSIMFGVGLSGFYLSFAGAFFYKGLLRAETLVVAFLVISACSYGFSWWRSTKPFLFLGLLGGLAAAFMGLYHNDLILNMGLHGVAMLPAWILIARKKWTNEGILIWIVTSLMTMPALTQASQETRNVGVFVLVAFWLYALVGGHVVLHSGPENPNLTRELTVLGVFSGAMAPFVVGSLFSTGQPLSESPHTVGLLLRSWPGFFAILGYAALAGTGSRIGLRPGPSRWLAGAALAVAIIVPPFALTFFQATVVFGFAAIVLAVASRKFSGCSSLAVIEVGLAYASYIGWSSEPVALHSPFQLPVLALLAVATLCVGGLSAPTGKEEKWSVPAGIAVWLIGVRAAVIGLEPRGVAPLVAFCWACFVFVACASLLAALKRWKLTAVLSAVVGSLGLVTAFDYVLTAPNVSLTLETPLFIGPLISGLLLGRAFLAIFREDSEPVWATFCAVLWLPFARIAWLWIAFSGVDGIGAGIWSIALSSALIAWVSIRQKSLSAAWVSVGVVLTATFPFVLQLTPQTLPYNWSRSGELWSDVGLMACLCLIGRTFHLRRPLDLERIVAMVSAPIGLLGGRIAYLILVWPPINLQNVYSVEMATLVYGLALSLLATQRKWRMVAGGAFANLFIALLLYPPMKVSEFGLVIPAGRFITREENLSVLVGLFLLSLSTAKALMRSGVDQRPVLHLSALLNWAIASGLFIHTLDLPPFRLTFDASVSFAWTVYAATLLLIGFRFNVPVLRYWALSVFGMATLKVVLYDLAFLDPVVKVVVAIGLGSVMMGGGYVYIRSQRGKDRADAPTPPPVET